MNGASDNTSTSLQSVRDLIHQAAGRGASLSEAAMSSIRGRQDALSLLATIREGCAPADALLDGMVHVLQLGDPERTRGFFRELQKRLERSA